MRERLLDRRWPWLVAVAGLLLLLLSTFVDVRFGDDWDTRPRGGVDDIVHLKDRSDLNVLFILIDTLRADHLGAYGYHRDTSPVLDTLASGGVRFARQLSQASWTKASMASLWTGLYPVKTGITRYDSVIPDAAQMPAEIFHAAGFQTIGLWRNGWVSPTFGFDQGFDVYQRPLPNVVPPNVRRDNPTLSEKGSDMSAIDAATEFLRVSGRDPWFLYLHLMDLHEYTYDADSALFGSRHADLYDNAIRWTDGSIHVLLQALSDQHLLDKTLIVICSDHGEAFLERGFEGHARRVYRETTEVPFLLSFPFRLEPGVVVTARTRNIDVWPTVYDLLGLKAPEGLDGRSRLPDILASARGKPLDDTGRIAIADLDQNWSRRDSKPLPTIAVVDGTHRYVRVDREEGPPTEELFDSASDPREMHDLSKQDPKTVERLRGLADAYYEQKPSWGKPPTREIDELELNLLRALGYQIK